LSFEQIENELKYLMEIDHKMFELSLKLLKKQTNQEIQKLEKLGVLSNLLRDEIQKALYELSKRKLSDTEAKKILYLVRISNALEQLGDVAEDMGALPKNVFEGGLNLKKSSISGLEKVFLIFISSLEEVIAKFPEKSTRKIKLVTERTKIEPMINEIYRSYIEVLKVEELDLEKEYSGSLFVESVSIMENSIAKLREVIVLSDLYYVIKQQDKESNTEGGKEKV
jgi:Na+/phosphate symporter